MLKAVYMTRGLPLIHIVAIDLLHQGVLCGEAALANISLTTVLAKFKS